MKSSSQGTHQQNSSSPDGIVVPIPTDPQQTSAPLSPTQSHTVISRVLLGSVSNPPPATVKAVRQQPTKIVKQSPRRRRKTLVGVGIVAAVVAAAVMIVTQTEIIQKLSNTSVLTQTVNGTVDAELLRLAGQNSAEIRLGAASAAVSNGNFAVQGTAENTGLASLTAGDETLGMNLVPKSSALVSNTLPISLESTAVALVMIRPEISDVFVLGNPLLDAAAYEVLLQSSQLQSVVSELRTEAESEGATYLRELSSTTEARITEATEWFRAIVSEGSGDFANLSTRRNRNNRAITNSKPESQARELPQSCDEGLLPTSIGEADGLCIEVTTPNREDWETFDFSKNMEVNIRNLSPRAAAIFIQDIGGPQTFLGLVPPLDLTLPTTSKLLMKIFDGPTRIFNLTPDTPDSPDKEIGSKFKLSGASNESVLTTVTFDWPGIPGVENPEFDQLVAANGLESYRNMALGLTSLSTYLLPVIGLILDRKGSQLEGLKDCPTSLISEIAKSVIDSELTAGQDSRLDQLLDSEGITKLFWMVVATNFLGSDCDEAEKTAGIITVCYPTIRTFWTIMPGPDDTAEFKECLGDFAGYFDAVFYNTLLKKALVPTNKLDSGLAVLGLARSAAWSARDAKRFADGDQYELLTLKIPRWCYEVAASQTRLFGVFGELQLDTTGNFFEKLREVIQDFLIAITQLVEVGGNLTNEATWEREAQAWKLIAEIAPVEVRPDAESLAELFRAVSTEIPNLRTADSRADRLFALPKILKLIRDLPDLDLSALDVAWESCPQS